MPEPLSSHQRQRLAQEALRSVRRLAESLEHQGDNADGGDVAALLGRVQAAIEPLRATTRATLTGEGTLGSSARLDPPAGLSGSGTLSVGVCHVLQVEDLVQPQEPTISSGTATITVTAGSTGHATSRGAAAATIEVTGTATTTGPAPDTFQATADDVPLLLQQILLAVDDLNGQLGQRSPWEVANFVSALIGLLLTAAGLLRGQ